MRHRKNTIKLGRRSAHRDALLAGLVCDLIAQRRVTTTLAKAKAARPLAEKMVTLGKQGTLAARRLAVSRLRQKNHVRTLFDDLAPTFKDRAGGYTRIIRKGRRSSDGSEMVILEWVEGGEVAAPGPAPEKTEEKPAKKPAKSAKKAKEEPKQEEAKAEPKKEKKPRRKASRKKAEE